MSLKQWAAELKAQVVTLWFCRKHPDTPLSAKLLAGFIVAYAFSPIDLIPDFIPVLGYLDDLLIVPLGVYFTLRLIPPHVLAAAPSRPRTYWVAGAIVFVWIAVAYWAWTMVKDRL